MSRYGNPANESRRERELRCAPLPKPNLCPQIFTRGRPPPGTDDHGCATLRALGLNDHGCSVRTAPVAIGPPDADSPSCIARLRSACSRSASLWPPPLLQLASDFGAGLPHATTEALTIAGPAFERRDASFAGGWGSARRASSRPPVGSIGCGCGLRLHHAGKTVRPQRGHGSRWRASSSQASAVEPPSSWRRCWRKARRRPHRPRSVSGCARGSGPLGTGGT